MMLINLKFKHVKAFVGILWLQDHNFIKSVKLKVIELQCSDILSLATCVAMNKEERSDDCYVGIGKGNGL